MLKKRTQTKLKKIFKNKEKKRRRNKFLIITLVKTYYNTINFIRIAWSRLWTVEQIHDIRIYFKQVAISRNKTINRIIISMIWAECSFFAFIYFCSPFCNDVSCVLYFMLCTEVNNSSSVQYYQSFVTHSIAIGYYYFPNGTLQPQQQQLQLRLYSL